MVVLNKIYTRTGDGGETALGDGARVPKTHELVEAYGTVDELNSVIGMARLSADGGMGEALARIQNELFDLGADLCTPLESGGEHALRMLPEQTARLEAEIDEMNKDLEPLRSFVLPGGSPLAAHLHLARTVARRAERAILRVEMEINMEGLRYCNRLSDWFFVAARVANKGGANDVLWVPGASRE